MSLRWNLPLVAGLNFTLALVLYGVSSAVPPADTPVPPLDPESQGRLDDRLNPPEPPAPPAFTTLDPIDVATLDAACPPLPHDPWRGQIRTMSDGTSAYSHLLLAHGEVLSLTGEIYHYRQRKVATSALSLVALPRSPYQQTTTRTVLPRQFRWFALETPEAFFSYEQPAANGQDTLVRYDRDSLAETGRWALPRIPSPATIDGAGPIYRIEVPTTLADGRIAVCITAGDRGVRDKYPPRMQAGLCLIDPGAPSSSAPPPYVLVPDLTHIAYAWPTVGTEVHAIAGFGGKQQRVLLDWATGTVRPVAPDDPRFAGYAASPPRVPADPALDSYVAWRNTHGGIKSTFNDSTATYGPGALALYMPVADVMPLANGVPGPADFEHPDYIAAAPRVIRRTAQGVQRYSLAPATRDLALAAAPILRRQPFEVFALDADRAAILQLIPALPNASDPALRDGCLRLGLLDIATGRETWLGTIAFPEEYRDTPEERRLWLGKLDNRLVIACAGREPKPAIEEQLVIHYDEQGQRIRQTGPSYRYAEFWTALDLPADFPADLPTGWLSTMSPPPGTPIP